MWFWWALSAAFVSSLSVIYNKRVLNRGIKPSVLSLFLFLVLTIVSLPLMLNNNTSTLNTTFFLACGISALVFSLAKTIQLNIFKKTNLSDIYALNSLSPVTLYILSVLFLNEQIKATATIGILSMAVGIYILNYDYHNKNPLHPLIVFVKNKYSQLYLGGMILSNISSLAEKTALNNTFPSNVYYLAFWENFFLVLIIGAYIIKTNRGWIKEVKTIFFNS